MNRATPDGSKSGFTLIELLVGTILSAVVLLGIFNFMTSVVLSEVKNQRADTVAAWSLTGVNSMLSDIAGASQLSYPAPGAGADYLIVCSNWSAKMNTTGGAVLNGGSPQSQQYCYDTTDAAPYQNAILRRTTASCPAAPVTPCTTGNYGADSVIATGVYRDALADPIFFADNKTLNGVRVRFSVGNPAANSSSAGSNGTLVATPVTIPYDTEIILED